jgi:hypothetical protein
MPAATWELFLTKTKYMSLSTPEALPSEKGMKGGRGG